MRNCRSWCTPPSNKPTFLWLMVRLDLLLLSIAAAGGGGRIEAFAGIDNGSRNRIRKFPTSSTQLKSSFVDKSTLTLLEHVNLNVPDHTHVLPFYYDLLECGMDPRKAANLQQQKHQQQQKQATPPDNNIKLAEEDAQRTSNTTTTMGSSSSSSSSKTLWANCGASQFHLPYGDTAQVLPGVIGVRMHQWDAFTKKCSVLRHSAADADADADAAHAAASATVLSSGTDAYGTDFVKLADHYGNVFMCRPVVAADNDDGNSNNGAASTRNIDRKQPVIAKTETTKWGDVIASKYGRADDETGCAGIDFVQFDCPLGTAAKIALFYETVLDATTTVIQNGGGNDCATTTALIAIGNVDANGKADQTLIFAETSSLPRRPYDGHHIALYVGETAADFEQAFKNCEIAGVVWVNPRFTDKADTLARAREFKQFRFKDIVDMETGETVFHLEHEMRSIEHDAWPPLANEKK